ncbi:MAG TPA: hypothetical protein VMA32_07755 [Streptosporangiaceae bacterium]|nr:hypothetical protein [Streptosporangiaceae bacterium]
MSIVRSTRAAGIRRVVTIRTTAILAAVLGGATSCATSSPAPSSPPPTSAAAAVPATSATPSSSTGAAVAAGCDTTRWRASPISSARQVSVPPMPVITAVRTAAHPECGYDRLVLDVTGPIPGYKIRYVTKAVADPSGAAISVPGSSYLLVTLSPANAHAASGVATISTRAQALRYPELKGYVLAGDFEGVVTLVLGLAKRTAIRTGEAGGRWYIDVRS